ncbi:MAG: VOC family protein [Candidatus Elarobacter sp.]
MPVQPHAFPKTARSRLRYACVMTESRAESAPTFYPVFRYRDCHAAIAWLANAFGFAEQVVYAAPNGDVAHAQMSFGTGIIMLGTARGEVPAPAGIDDPLPGSGGAYVFVPDVDAHHAGALAAKAIVVREPVDTEYGSREYSARDLEGNLWHFGTYRPHL